MNASAFRMKLYVSGELPQELRVFTNSSFDNSGIDESDLILHNEVVCRKRSEWWLVDLAKCFAEKQLLARKLRQVSRTYSHLDKKVLVLVAFDYEHSTPRFENLILLRYSLRKSSKQDNEIAAPFLYSCLERPFSPSKKSPLPVVGFCGWTKHRKRLIQAFEKSPKIESVFIKRDRFWGGKSKDQNLRRDFYDNMKQTQFNLCQRGVGNYSMRFYQTLAAGRIPVLVDTDIELPFASEIPWKDFIVMGASEQDCVDKVVKCHAEGRVAEMQRNCAEAFHNYLSPTTYFARLAESLFP